MTNSFKIVLSFITKFIGAAKYLALAVIAFFFLLQLSDYCSIVIEKSSENLNYVKYRVSTLKEFVAKDPGGMTEKSKKLWIHEYNRLQANQIPEFEKQIKDFILRNRLLDLLLWISLSIYGILFIIELFLKVTPFHKSVYLYISFLILLIIVFTGIVIITTYVNLLQQNDFLMSILHSIQYSLIKLEFLALLPLVLSYYLATRYLKKENKGLRWKNLTKVSLIAWVGVLFIFNLLYLLFSGHLEWEMRL